MTDAHPSLLFLRSCVARCGTCAGVGARVQIIAALVQIGAIITERVAFLYRSIAIKLVLQ